MIDGTEISDNTSKRIQAMLDKRAWAQAEQTLILELVAHPNSPEAMHLMGQLLVGTGKYQAAIGWLCQALQHDSTRANTLILLGKAQEQVGLADAACQSLQDALDRTQLPSDLLSLSVEAERQGLTELALGAISRALARNPAHVSSQLQYAKVLQGTGDSLQAAEICRRVISNSKSVTHKNDAARAWFALMDLKTVKLSASEYQRLQDEAARSKSLPDQMLLNYALGHAHEAQGAFAAAFSSFAKANQLAAASHVWSAQGFYRHVEAIQRCVATSVASDQLGGELIFLVGLPRSGTTLVEQVLAAHPAVEGAGELSYLPDVIQRESERRGKTFPLWVPDAKPADWQRLATQYLTCTARFRKHKQKSTDKLPENWLYLGALMQMFPACKIIDCLRDPIETTWSCYKQLFAQGRVGFSYRFSDLGAFWRGYRETMAFWQMHDAKKSVPQIRSQQYEALVQDTETQVRDLLSFCDLDFAAACLQSHRALRAIRTPSAAQVRQPMTTVSIKAAGYGALLDDLRAQLTITQPL